MILGTAGHVDHGKTALVRALTGVDTDRLAEEKRRGITIELGFAPLRLADDLLLGVVDVPGHEAFVRTMVAGATGVDLALLVVAADEGVMPQTREHLEILRLLGTRGGVVAISKADLTEPDWLAMVEEELSDALRHTPLAQAAIVRTSAVTGEGLETLRSALASAARALPGRVTGDLFRLPVDRAFTVRGTGTVVTGTVWSGRIERDAQLRILPWDAHARVRALEMHGASVDAVAAGTRAAIALSNVDVSDVPRGAVLVSDRSWRATTTLLAEVVLTDDAPESVGPRRRLRFHLGTADVEARVVAAGGALAPGDRRQVRIVLTEPVVARGGDRFVLRSGSPVTTIGGGVVNDPIPARPRPRPWPRAASNAAERLALMLELEGDTGLAVDALAVRTGAPRAEVDALMAAQGAAVVRVGGSLFGARRLEAIRARLLSLVDEFHRSEPLEPGVPLQLLRSRFGAAGSIADVVLAELVSEEVLHVEGARVSRAGWVARMSPAQQRVSDTVLATLTSAGKEPPSGSELVAELGPEVRPVLRHLLREGLVVQVEADRYYEAGRLEQLVAELCGAMHGEGSHSPAALREALGLTRKFLIPLLEYCDRIGITEREGDGRLLRHGTVRQLDT